jgi:hypothetical protein
VAAIAFNRQGSTGTEEFGTPTEGCVGPKVRGQRAGAAGIQTALRSSDPGQAERVAPAQTQGRPKSWQVFSERRNMTSSTGNRFSLAISSATRLTSHGPDGSPSNSPW